MLYESSSNFMYLLNNVYHREYLNKRHKLIFEFKYEHY